MNKDDMVEFGKMAQMLEAMQRAMTVMNETIQNQGSAIDVIGKEGIEAIKRVDEQRAAHEEFVTSTNEVLSDLIAKVDGRNKSAAIKRNMTDLDARRVLDGDMKEADHKTAAIDMGLTYAQVYSCRLEYTFKHVHKVLRDEQWKNPWRKK